jgi:SOS regulatory protein LexA
MIQGNILKQLQAFYAKHRRGPSYSELAQMAGFASKQAAYRLAQKLIDAGILARDPTGKLIPNGPRLGTPLLGYVQAGFPSPAEEELIDTLSLDEYLIRKPAASFLLRVTGDSMIDAGIHPDDIVIIERGKHPSNGAIVLAEVDHEWTLKYYHKRGTRIELRPANPQYPVITARTELNLGGVVRGVIRRY